MVKIRDDSSDLSLRAEGRLVFPWLEVMDEECRAAAVNGRRVTLDVSRVTFVAPAGIALLRELTSLGVRLTGASPILAGMLDDDGGD